MTPTPSSLTKPQKPAAQQSVSTRERVRDLIAFVGTLIAATFFGWQTEDLIWGLWICSLTFGYTTILVAIVMGVARSDSGLWIVKIVGVPFVLAFFTIHFGGFHFGHAMFLDAFFPLPRGPLGPRGIGGNPFELAVCAFANYFPMVVATFVSRFSDLPFRAERVASPVRLGGKSELAAKVRGAAFVKPYINVVRMHLMIFVFIGLSALRLSDFAIYPVLFFYFFPWRMLIPKRAAA